MPLILEGLVTTLDAAGGAHLAPMGPEVDESLSRLVFKPYQTSTTYRNLARTGQGVFHVVDDVELLARAAVGQVDPLPPMRPAAAVEGWVLTDACRFVEFRVTHLDATQERTRIETEVVAGGQQRDFFGFNRAKHAVLEGAILATRLERLPRAAILAQLEALEPWVSKTGGAAEIRAWHFIDGYIRQRLAR